MCVILRSPHLLEDVSVRRGFTVQIHFDNYGFGHYIIMIERIQNRRILKRGSFQDLREYKSGHTSEIVRRITKIIRPLLLPTQ